MRTLGLGLGACLLSLLGASQIHQAKSCKIWHRLHINSAQNFTSVATSSLVSAEADLQC